MQADRYFDTTLSLSRVDSDIARLQRKINDLTHAIMDRFRDNRGLSIAAVALLLLIALSIIGYTGHEGGNVSGSNSSSACFIISGESRHIKTVSFNVTQTTNQPSLPGGLENKPRRYPNG